MRRTSVTSKTMASLKAWFTVLKWSLIITNILLILLAIAPLIFRRPRQYSDQTNRNSTRSRDLTLIDQHLTEKIEREHAERQQRLIIINACVTISLCIIGLCSVCCYLFWPCLVYGLAMTGYLFAIIFLMNPIGNVGLYMTMLGVIACSFTYCAVLKRFEDEEYYY